MNTTSMARLTSKPVLCLLLTLLAGETQLSIAQTLGSLRVISDSGATVYLDNHFRGVVESRTDGTVIANLKPGSYVIRLRLLGQSSDEHIVTIKRGEQTEFTLRHFTTTPIVRETRPKPSRPTLRNASTQPGGVLGSERFVGLWKEIRAGIGGTPQFQISLEDSTFYVQMGGSRMRRDRLRFINLVGKDITYGVAELNGRIRQWGSPISILIKEHSQRFGPDFKNLTPEFQGSDTLDVMYWDVESAGPRFVGESKGIWVRIGR